jgi:hypothetical protein
MLRSCAADVKLRVCNKARKSSSHLSSISRLPGDDALIALYPVIFAFD